MSFAQLYSKTMPIITLYSTFLGIGIGIDLNHARKNDKSIERYSTLVGYTGLGMITGLTYPISYPLCGCYVLYKHF
jgi:hypothetical protein